MMSYTKCPYLAYRFQAENEKDDMDQEDAALIEQYQNQVKAGDTDAHPYDRLMIYYRKNKQYGEELQVIKRGLTVFAEQLKRQKSAVLKGGRKSSAIKTLSSQLSKAMGLVDKKGQDVYLPEPLPRWTRRRDAVEEKIRKAGTAAKKKKRK